MIKVLKLIDRFHKQENVLRKKAKNTNDSLLDDAKKLMEIHAKIQIAVTEQVLKYPVKVL
jgi:hypothetical protein